MNNIISLKNYFSGRADVVMAFLFGSQAKKTAGRVSDWDIAVYFKPQNDYLEWEEINADYPQQEAVWNDLIDILGTDDVDLVVLNRAPANIASSAIGEGLPLIIRDRGLFLDFMIAVSRQAEDYRDFVSDFYAVKQRSFSLAPKDKERLIRIIDFLEKELTLTDYFKVLAFENYKEDPHKRHDIERWVENIVNSCIDIGEIILASEKKLIPQSYKDIFLDLARLSAFKHTGIEGFARWVKLRNILAHEYLDIRWAWVEDFTKESSFLLSGFLRAAKEFIT